MFVKLFITIFILLSFSACSFSPNRVGPAKLLNPQEIFPEKLDEEKAFNGTWTSNKRPSDFGQFYAAEKDAASGRNIDNYIRQGISLSDMACKRWFDSLEIAQANTQFWKNNTAIAGGAAATVMGIVEASAKEIAGVAALFAGVNSVFENYQTVFLFTPDMHIVRSKINALRQELAKNIKNNIPSHYPDAKAKLVQYHEYCSGAAIKRLIQEAVVQTAYHFDIDKNVTNADKSIVDTYSKDINRLLSLPASTMDRSALLRRYLLVNHDDLDISDYKKPLDDEWVRLLTVDLKSSDIANYTRALSLLESIGEKYNFEKSANQLSSLMNNSKKITEELSGKNTNLVIEQAKTPKNEAVIKQLEDEINNLNQEKRVIVSEISSILKSDIKSSEWQITVGPAK